MAGPENSCLTSVNVYGTVYDMANDPITFEDERDEEDTYFALDHQAVAAIQAWLKLSPEDRIALERKRDRGGK